MRACAAFYGPPGTLDHPLMAILLHGESEELLQAQCLQ
jgi:hypothetical protein